MAGSLSPRKENMILSFDQLSKNNQPLITNNQHLVLVGGCFDILHTGHIEFLRKAKEKGTALVVLLESDTSIHKKKGPHRPVNSQNDRASVLEGLRSVDIVVLLPETTEEKNYYEVTKLLKPVIIATTTGDPHRDQKEKCAQAVNAQVIDVILPIADKSSSRIAQLLANEEV